MLATILLPGLTVTLSRCFHDRASGSDPRGKQYAGTVTCIKCHSGISTAYAHSSHFGASSVIGDSGLSKPAAPSNDRFYFLDSEYIQIEKKDDNIYQTLYTNGQPALSEHFDIAFGSGKKAQTFAYWQGDTLRQLPLTWYTTAATYAAATALPSITTALPSATTALPAPGTWANSPGFTPRHARYDRVIGSRCFECHASWVNRQYVPSSSLAVSEVLDRSSVMVGIDCERCHGPARQHAEFQQENPDIKTARYITRIRSLSRQQQLDLCAVCHSGNDKSTQRSLFDFIPGDTLSHFYYPDFMAEGKEPDVHGQQLQLLEQSKCFRMTAMTCTTCHDPHGKNDNKIPVMIAKCMDCHHSSAHATGIATIVPTGDTIAASANTISSANTTGMSTNCIDCHMPLQTSRMIYSNNGMNLKNIPYLMRTHKIAIYK